MKKDIVIGLFVLGQDSRRHSKAIDKEGKSEASSRLNRVAG